MMLRAAVNLSCKENEFSPNFASFTGRGSAAAPEAQLSSDRNDAVLPVDQLLSCMRLVPGSHVCAPQGGRSCCKAG